MLAVTMISPASSPLDHAFSAMICMPEMLVILAIVVVLFGATKLPQLGKGLGEAIGNFKKAQRDHMREDAEAVDATPRLQNKGDKPVDVELEERKSHV